MKILLVGDIHANTHDLRRAMIYGAEHNVQRVFFLGDFGWKFSDKLVNLATKMFVETGLYVEFIDGNHEDFNFIYHHPVSEDGYRYIAEGLRHIPRGTVIDIDGSKVLCMGGATSIDRIWRVKDMTWWPQEAITDKDMEAAGRNLIAVGGRVDAVFAHDGPVLPDKSNKNTADLLAMRPELEYDLMLSDSNRAKLEALMNVAMPHHWYHGHHHTRFTTELDTWYGGCKVECLDMDGTKISQATMIVHTDDWWASVDDVATTHEAFSWTDTRSINANA